MKGFAIWFLFSAVFAVKFGIDAFECTEEGFGKYLAEYPDKCGDDCDAYKMYELGPMNNL